ncbi:sensor histidine kinase inhibitor, KipI family [Desulfotomaculum arcticum]|uniref:Sensor histidine kinase inhibitor, KipI family n=1 Tax=Desulfotruncus arcticus DSM 17038 TaxID=1121424 RepID=A0A1I2PE23_9FIRM|nr:5-oxoprolinase subunit PxpB [Desulfotruncus arcticus]SFG11916.1 sensor histidine kinase inhibitor, KipI family [Desulfotomaculum arcticum] [Desulfotruncus arcticus DSM 17038]
MYKQARYLPAGDKGLVVEFGNAISPAINNQVRGFTLALEKAGLPGVMEYIPTYRSLLVIYNPLVWEPALLIARLREIESSLATSEFPDPVIYHLPVAYGGDFGPDLDFICDYTGLAAQDIIRLHSEADYLIYMLGFTPGFPYLGGMDRRIAAPRLETPRISIPAGSVGIAGSQTGIYPVASPGGWRVIGRTPVRLFEPSGSNPVLLSAGDFVRFFAVTPRQYRQIEAAVEKGAYRITVNQVTKCP